ncbi:MAG: DUF5317 domain-containing protein [Spirochaetaceae bacterium]|nr:DUF5317 domain-containing protein [Spirochaetaceae bacterium]
MIVLYAVVVGVLLGYAFHGRLSNLAGLPLRSLWLVLLALVIQVLIFPLFTREPLLPYGTAVLHGVSYGILLLWLFLNLRNRALLVVGAGALLNLVVVFANGGYMPASPAALRIAGLAQTADIAARGETYGNIVGNGVATRLNLHGDWIPTPPAHPFARAMSVGDVLIMAGLTWLLVKGMRTRVENS